MGRLKKIPDNSNGIVLSPVELIATAALVLALCYVALPWCYRHWQQIVITPDFRLSYALRDDYLGYRDIAGEICRKYPAVFLGDSVVWGMYVDNACTLPALINQRLGRETIGNLAIDGLHPVVLETLVREYGGAIRNKTVYLYWNPLWMNSPLYDLSGDGELAVNHPRLLPQLDLSLRSYRAGVEERVSALLERRIDFHALLHHLRVAFFENADLKNHLAAHPDENPLRRINMTRRPGETGRNVNGRIDWYNAGIAEQNWPWVAPDASRQWKSFLTLIRLLKERDNHVYVIAGTVNPHMQSAESLRRYRELRSEVLRRFQLEDVEVIDLPELPSDEYADASHPLAPGYQRLADFIFDTIMKKGRALP